MELVGVGIALANPTTLVGNLLIVSDIILILLFFSSLINYFFGGLLEGVFLGGFGVVLPFS
jgi:hypothetical protein